MRISYDNTVDAMKIKFNDKVYEKSLEVMEGIILDLTADGEIIALEILYVSRHDINPYEIVCRYQPVQT